MNSKYNMDIYKQQFLETEMGKKQAQKLMEIERETDVKFNQWVNETIFGIKPVNTEIVEDRINELNTKIDSIIKAIGGEE
jgi:hypothetical protein